MNELQRSIARIEDMLNSGQIEGAKHLLYIAQGHAQSVTDLISAQVMSMTEQQLKINKLNADVAMYKERMEHWKRRCRSIEDDARNIIPSTFKTWWAMIEAEYEIMQEKFNDSAIALNYMGCGASCHVTAGEIRKMLGEAEDETLQNLLAYGLHENLHGSDQETGFTVKDSKTEFIDCVYIEKLDGSDQDA